VRGKLIRRGLKTSQISVARLRLGDLESLSFAVVQTAVARLSRMILPFGFILP